MENNTEINKKIAKNLIHYRKAAGLTQAELAEKINYSDKSVSKWESGNGVPDVYTLLQLAELYGVTLNALVGEDTPQKQEKKTKSLHMWIMLLSSGIVWLVATCLFVMLELWKPDQGQWWLAFVYAVAANAIVLIVFSGLWRYTALSFLSVSTLIWTAITSIYFTVRFLGEWKGFDLSALWAIFLVGVPLQVLECLWVSFRVRARKHKKALNSVEKEKKSGKNEKSEKTEKAIKEEIKTEAEKQG